MVGLIHGYGLSGAGSNLWTREIASALCDNGKTVHLMCQESRPERYDFVAEVWVYDAAGEPERVLQREVPAPGRCIVHRPVLDVLPTYVRPDRKSEYVFSILDLDDDAIEGYVERNVRALERIVDDHSVRSWHVNHAVLLSEATRRLKERRGVGYGVMPHGSALEYVVRHDERMQRVTRRVLEEADSILALNPEIRERLARMFPDLDLEGRTVTVPVGVDTDRFRPVPRSERAQSVDRLEAALVDAERGRAPAHGERLRNGLQGEMDREGFRALVDAVQDYPTGLPDQDLESKLREVDWGEERVLLFAGRIIPAKGVAGLVVALPQILERHPRTRLVLAGAGWLREYLEAFIVAIGRGQGDLAARIIDWSAERSAEDAQPAASLFLRILRERGEYGSYVEAARSLLDADRVVFTGFLEHPFLAHVFPLADVAVFPSAVPEASPLVVPEAAACGCLPMGTYDHGMKHSLDSLAPVLPERLRPLMRLSSDPARTVLDIVENVGEALDQDAGAKEALRRAAVQEYDWHGIARDLSGVLDEIGAGAPRKKTPGVTAGL